MPHDRNPPVPHQPRRYPCVWHRVSRANGASHSCRSAVVGCGSAFRPRQVQRVAGDRAHRRGLPGGGRLLVLSRPLSRQSSPKTALPYFVGAGLVWSGWIGECTDPGGGDRLSIDTKLPRNCAPPTPKPASRWPTFFPSSASRVCWVKRARKSPRSLRAAPPPGAWPLRSAARSSGAGSSGGNISRREPGEISRRSSIKRHHANPAPDRGVPIPRS